MVDMQVGVVRDAFEVEAVTSTIRELVGRARRADVSVVWVQDHSEDRAIGSEDWQLVTGLDPASDEPRIGKAYGDAFAETDLEDMLAERGVGELVLLGAASEQCIRCTLHSAIMRGYDIALVKGGHTTTDLTAYGIPKPQVVVKFMDMVTGYGMQWPGRESRSVTTAEIAF